METTNDRSVTE